MAKNQGLSLNPTKISGLCGRLMCCLKYEDEYYAETLKLMPKVGAEITMPEGVAVVESVDMLRQTIKARVTLKNGETEIKQYHASQLPQNAKVQEVEEADQADELDVVEE
jgi:cell fate regulator YaaT (PSP1 superfamily)